MDNFVQSVVIELVAFIEKELFLIMVAFVGVLSLNPIDSPFVVFVLS